MNKLRKMLISVLSVMLFVCMGLFAAACDDGEETPPAEKVYYTVSVEYEASQGSVTLSPAAENGKYEENTSVTVSVTPNTDYGVDSVKANGSALTANGEGKYVFTVKGDTTVSVTFKAQGEVPPADEKVSVTVDCGSEGSYTLDPAPVDGKIKKGESVTLTVTPNANYEVESVKVNGSEVTANIYIMLVGDNLYTLIWSDPYVSVGDTLFSKSQSSFSPYESEEYIGEWVGVTNPDDTISIRETGSGLAVTFNGEDVAVNLNAEFKYNGKNYGISANGNILTLFENYYMEDNPDILAERYSYIFIKKDCPELFVTDSDLLGTEWTSAVINLAVDQDGKVTVDGVEGKVIAALEHENGVGGHSYTVIAGNKAYDIYHDTDSILSITEYGGYTYTLGNGHVEQQYYGTWKKNGSGTVGSCLVIDRDGCTFDGESIQLVRAGIVDGYVFTVTDTEGDSKTYTIQLLMDFEAYFLGVSYVENERTENAYYLKETTVPTVIIDDMLIGEWTGDGDPLLIYKTSIFYGRYLATVFANPTDTDSNVITYFVYANGDLFFLIYNMTEATIELRNYGSDEYGAIYSTRADHPTSDPLPEKYRGKWADDQGNTIVVDKDGMLRYNGAEAVLAKVKEDYYNVTVGIDEWNLQWEEDGRLCLFNSVFEIYHYFEKVTDTTA